MSRPLDGSSGPFMWLFGIESDSAGLRLKSMEGFSTGLLDEGRIGSVTSHRASMWFCSLKEIAVGLLVGIMLQRASE